MHARRLARSGALASAAALAATLLVAALAPSSAEAKLVAPHSKCAGQQNAKAPGAKQERALRCLIEYARRHAASGKLRPKSSLERAAGRKASDVMDCGLSHTACGKPADLYPKRYGYTSGASSWQWGENLAWGKRRKGTARQVLKAWLGSPPHRAAMLDRSFEHLGIGLRRGSFSGSRRAAVWALELGCRGC
ncbi:MAG: hypothetical protein GEU88_09635 [Solirubrobacterales bacterium]|nr:hypothetical protein [Solirubrobacterales bacterium]